VGGGAVLTRAMWQGRGALADGDRALADGDRERAIRDWRRAARWYVPLAPHGSGAYDRLEAIGREAEASGDLATALAAWQGVRGSILATRSFYLAHGERLAPANRRIAAIFARIEAAESAAPNALADPPDRVAWHYHLLARDTAPNLGWSLLALTGFATWLGGGVLFAWRGVSRDDRLAPAPATTAGLLIAAGLTLWLLGLYQA